MFCPNCGTQNPDGSKFCSSCGKTLGSLPASVQDKRPIAPSSAYSIPAKPANPLTSAATWGGLAGIAGGALIVLGWFLGGGLPILSLVFAGGLLGGSLAGDEAGAVFALLALALAAVVVYVPITGFLSARTGVNLFELRAYTTQHYIAVAKGELQLLRSRATKILIMMILMAAFVSIIPFIGQALLGQGYWLMVFGAVVIFLGSIYARTQIGLETALAVPKSEQRQLNEKERQVLWLLAEGQSPAEIAQRLDCPESTIQSLQTTLLQKFEADDTALLIKRAQTQGILPPK